MVSHNDLTRLLLLARLLLTLEDNVILLVAPASEFGVSNPMYRVTAFSHTGDFGANPPHDWSGDQHPRVTEGLAPFVRED